MARSRVRSSQSVTLFPFLAVLVCAMGALILLLIVTTRRIRRQTIDRAAVVAPQPKPKATVPAPAPPQVQPTIPAIQTAIASSTETDRIIAAHFASIRQRNAELESTFHRMTSQRKAARQQYDQLVREQKAAEQRLRNARLQQQQLEATRKSLDATSATDRSELQKLEQQIQSSARTIERYRRELNQLKSQAAEASSQFAIVPFDGRTGTTRRPIYIECTEKSLRFLPEDVAITANELRGFNTDFNPVLAGAQSLVNYWKAKKRADVSGDEPEPYVLLLVRPGGSIAYYAARKMLKELGQPIGYELIESDWRIALPDADPAARDTCRRAVEQVLAVRRKALQSAIAARLRSGNANGRPSQLTGETNNPRNGGSQNVDGNRAGSKSRMMRFNRATGRFEIIKPNREPSLGPFGRALDDSRGDVSRIPGTGPQPENSLEERSSKTSANGNQTKPNVGNSSRFNRRATGLAGNISQGTRGTTESQQRGIDGTASGRSSRGLNDDPFNSSSAKQIGSGNRQPPGSPDGNSESGPFGQSSTGDWQAQSETARKSNGKNSSNSTQSNSRTGGPSSTVSGNTGKKSQGENSRNHPLFTQKRRWGLSDRRAGIGFEREITIWSSANRIRIGKTKTLTVGKGESREVLLRSVAAAVDGEARSWGKPPKSFYWVPTLRFVISPGGNQHYDRLKSGLQKMGLPSVAEHRLETTVPPTPIR